MWTQRFFIFFQLLLNTSFHRITLGQSDSAPIGAPSIHWTPEHWFPLDHTGPEWFSTHRHTIHPLDAWTCCGWTWTSPVPSPPVLAHRHRLTNRRNELICMILKLYWLCKASLKKFAHFLVSFFIPSHYFISFFFLCFYLIILVFGVQVSSNIINYFLFMVYKNHFISSLVWQCCLNWWQWPWLPIFCFASHSK